MIYHYMTWASSLIKKGVNISYENNGDEGDDNGKMGDVECGGEFGGDGGGDSVGSAGCCGARGGVASIKSPASSAEL